MADPDTCCIKIIHWGIADGPLEPSIPFLRLPLGIKSLTSSGKWVNSGCRVCLKLVSYPFILPWEVLWRSSSFMNWWRSLLCKVRIQVQKYEAKSFLQSSHQLFDNKRAQLLLIACTHLEAGPDRHAPRLPAQHKEKLRSVISAKSTSGNNKLSVIASPKLYLSVPFYRQDKQQTACVHAALGWPRLHQIHNQNISCCVTKYFQSTFSPTPGKTGHSLSRSGGTLQPYYFIFLFLLPKHNN